MPVKLICSKLFFIQLFSRMTFNGRLKHQKTMMSLNVSKMLPMNLAKEENHIGVSLLIHTSFARFL